jgi:class 3 adenylate cyclase
MYLTGYLSLCALILKQCGGRKMAAISSATPALNSLWERWSAVPPGLSRDKERLHNTLALSLPQGWLVHFFYIFLFAFWGIWPLAVFNILSVLIYTVAVFFWRQQRYGLALWPVAIELIIHSTLVIIFIGWGFGAQYYILTLLMGSAINTWFERRTLIITGISYTLLFIGWYYYTVFFTPLYTVPALQLAVFNILNIVAVFSIIVRIPINLVAETDRANKANEDLLNNVLPKPIAARLKKKESTIADGFQNASILFADLTGFTRLSLKLKPDDLVQMLDVIFSRFDELVDQCGLEKIKTIGDEYMVASGIPIPRDDHAQALANFALAMRDSLDEYAQASNIDLQMRIGINSGPVVAGVIGKRRFLYDLWGDSVNTASRMESHGIPGKIQVTEATRDLLDGRFTFVDRGMIDIKGKGPMQTYLLQPNGHA